MLKNARDLQINELKTAIKNYLDAYHAYYDDDDKDDGVIGKSQKLNESFHVLEDIVAEVSKEK